MEAYYNENDPYPAQWLRNLVAAGHIARGPVDDRDIREVKPEDVQHYTQAHFFAGIGGWSYALRLAGWGDDRSVWTGSCPCQPWSSAGKHRGADDPRHLWPEWFRLIRECRPPVVFGEQVASKDGLAWLDLVCADLEGEGYAVAAVDLCAAGVQAPHLRQRLYFVAHAEGGNGRLSICEQRQGQEEKISEPEWRCEVSQLGNSAIGRLPLGDAREIQGETCPEVERPMLGGFWQECDWLPCRDERYRPTQPGIFPLAHGIPGRVGRLRAYGNAIVPQVATTFIEAYMEIILDRSRTAIHSPDEPAEACERTVGASNPGGGGVNP